MQQYITAFYVWTSHFTQYYRYLDVRICSTSSIVMTIYIISGFQFTVMCTAFQQQLLSLLIQVWSFSTVYCKGPWYVSVFFYYHLIVAIFTVFVNEFVNPACKHLIFDPFQCTSQCLSFLYISLHLYQLHSPESSPYTVWTDHLLS